MKNLFLALVATVVFSGGQIFSNNIENEKIINPTSEILKCDSFENIDDSSRDISISIDWGRRSRDCRGFGICGITITIDIVFRASSSDGRLVLNFDEKTKKEVMSNFNENSIILEEDFMLPRELTSSLNLKDGYTLKAGKYSIKTTDNGEKGQYQVKF